MKQPIADSDQYLLKAKPEKRHKASPRPVSLLEGEDFRCAMYGSMGFSTYFIMRHTNLTTSQIAYRLRKGSIRRKDFRNGQTIVAARLLQQVRTVAIPAVKKHLKEVMKGKKGAG